MKKYLAFQFSNGYQYIRSHDIEGDRLIQLAKRVNPESIVYFDGKNRYNVKTVEMARNIYSGNF
jgi:hypothetical protein